LSCGDASARDTSVAFEMNFKLYFVKKGRIEFLYRKDSVRERDGWISGQFSFYVDNISVLDDSNIMDDPYEWKHFSFDIYPGMKEVSFIYQKFNTDMNQLMHLEIKVITIFKSDRTIRN
jgi:hypothetical protein